MTETLVPQKPLVEALCAIQGTLCEENQKVFAKASMNLGKTWGKNIPLAKNLDDLMGQIATYLQQDFQLAKTVTFTKDGPLYVLQVRSCYICHGKLVRERHGMTPACAISLFPVGAIVENLKMRNVRLREIRKPGKHGDCDLVYEAKR